MKNRNSILSMPGTQSVQSTQSIPGYSEYDGNYSNYISQVNNVITNLNNSANSANRASQIFNTTGGAVRFAKRSFKDILKANCVSMAGKNAVSAAMKNACNKIPSKSGILKKVRQGRCLTYVNRKQNEFENWRNKGCASDGGDYPDDGGGTGDVADDRGGKDGKFGGGGTGGRDQNQAGFGGGTTPEQTKQILLWGGMAILTAAVIVGGVYGYKALMKPAANPKLLTA